MTARRLIIAATTAAVAAVTVAVPAATAATSPPNPSLAYTLRDLGNIANAYGRVTGPGGQLLNANYLPALVTETSALTVAQLVAQAATPTRPALTAGALVPGWNVGNPLRAGWNGTRGVITPVSFTNRHGALLRGDVFTPRPGAKDPYTGRTLTGPFPGVVITPGSVQGSERMYWWLAQDLAERGYVVLAYDVQGQGQSETLPHEGTEAALPYCNLVAQPAPTELLGCPGVPSQQPANFVKGTEDATDFFFSTPQSPYANAGAAGTPVDAFNPQWQQFDRSADPQAVTPGRTSRFAIIGHSLGAAAVSRVQGTDTRVSAVVALDKLQAGEPIVGGATDVGTVTPVVPALAVQSEYGFTVTPAGLSEGSSLFPSPGNPRPMRERESGFEGWRRAGVDSMLIVPRASTHLEYTDIPLVLPASRNGQALTSTYVQRWLDRYLKHEGVAPGATGTDPLLATSVPYLEPVGRGTWKPITLNQSGALSFYYCSAYSIAARNGVSRLADGDIAGVGGCPAPQ